MTRIKNIKGKLKKRDMRAKALHFSSSFYIIQANKQRSDKGPKTTKSTLKGTVACLSVLIGSKRGGFDFYFCIVQTKKEMVKTWVARVLIPARAPLSTLFFQRLS